MQTEEERVEMKEVSEEGKPAVVCLSRQKGTTPSPSGGTGKQKLFPGPDRRRVAFQRAPFLRSRTHRVEAKRQYCQRRTPDSEPARLSCGHVSGF